MTRLARVTLTFLLAGALGAPAPTRQAVAADASVAALKARSAKKARRKVRARLRKGGLAELPSVASALAGRREPSARRSAAVVAGTPPALVEIPGRPIKDLFWRPGVIDAIAAGTPTPEQCNEFFAGTQDGVSGGLGACHMAESVGYSFANVLRGDTSLCYMKRFPTPENVAAGGVTVLAGELPGGDITRVFSVPRGATPRIVQVAVTGDSGGRDGRQDVFLRVYASAENRAAGNAYKVDIWFCHDGPATPPSGYDRLTIDDAGHLTDESADAESGTGGDWAHVSTVDGWLTFAAGAVSYDTTRGRRALVEAVFEGNAFKGAVEIVADDTMVVKSYDAGPWGARKGYVVNAFAGSGPDSLRFLAGAFKERHSSDGTTFGGDVTGATEFRESFYAAAPASDLVGPLDAVDLDGDAFYVSPPAPSVDTSAHSCAVTPDVVLALDFDNPAIRAAVAECEDRRFDGMHFCHEDVEVRQADMRYWQACSPGPH